MRRLTFLVIAVALLLSGYALAGMDVPPVPVDLSGYSTKTEVTAQVAASVTAKRYTNTAIPAGNTVTLTTETAFASKAALPAAALSGSGTRGTVLLFGLYTSTGVTPSITPRIRLGGVLLLPARSITGLLASTNVPWQARIDLLVTDSGIVATGILTIDDNQVRIFGGAAVTGIDLSQALDVTASAAWGQSGCSITLQGMIVDVLKPVS